MTREKPKPKPKRASGKNLGIQILLRAPAAEVALWTAAAERAGLTRTEWIRRRLAETVDPG